PRGRFCRTPRLGSRASPAPSAVAALRVLPPLASLRRGRSPGRGARCPLRLGHPALPAPASPDQRPTALHAADRSAVPSLRMPAFLRPRHPLGPLTPHAVRLVQNGSRRRTHLSVRSPYLAVLIVVLLYLLLIAAGAGTKGYRELAAAGAPAFTVTAYLQV